jgi:tetratricopeptide (TPR) repeat protein
MSSTAIDRATHHAQAGELQRARELCETALQDDPADPDALHLLGALELALGDHAKAAEHIQQAIAIDDSVPKYFNNLGNALRALGRADEARTAYQRAIELEPGFDDAHFNLAALLHAGGENDRALAEYRRTIEINPNLADAHKALGEILVARQDYAAAIDALRQAARLDTQHRDLIPRLAIDLENENRLEAARLTTERGLALYPEDPLLRLTAAKLARREGHLDAALQQLRGLDLEGTRPEVRAAVNQEIGLIQDRRGDHTAAYRSFVEANRIQAGTFPEKGIAKGSYLGMVDTWARTFDRSLTDAWAPLPAEAPSPAPIFIVGFPRSGTTLLDQILDSHPRLRTVEEKPLVNELLAQAQDLPGPLGFPHNLAGLDRAQLERLRNSYFEAASRHVTLEDGEVLVDKFPLNIIRAPLIWRIFPQARFILALRHPCDVCLSCFMHLFNSNDAMANLTSLEDTTALYSRVMGLWMRYTTQLPLRHRPVRYEDVVGDLEGEARRLLDFLGVAWDDSVLRFYEHARQRPRIDTPSYHQVTRPIYREAVDRWRRYEDPLAPYLERLRPFVEAFGYKL